MIYRFKIDGRLPGINELIAANRTSPYKGAKLKADAERIISVAINQQLRGIKIVKPIVMRYTYWEGSRKRDLDNVSGFAHKVIQDALVKRGVLRNDGWNEIKGYEDYFKVDKDNPRIEVEMEEYEV